MKFDGAMYNPLYSGEGFSLNQSPDGKVTVHFFSYHSDGSQLFLVGSGMRINDYVVAEMEITHGGMMGIPVALANVVREPWGHITISHGVSVMRATFEPIGKPSWGYNIQPIHNVPPVEEPPGLQLEVKAKFPPYEFLVKPLPYVGGSVPINADDITTTAKEWQAMRLTNHGSLPALIRPSKSGPNNPRVYGIPVSGKTLNPDASVIVTFSIGPLTPNPPAGHQFSYYGLHVENVQIVEGQVQVLPGN